MFFCVAAPALAQTTDFEVSVEYIAGQNIYIGVGNETGLVRRDTVDVFRDSNLLGRLRIISITSRRAVTTFVGERFPVDFSDRFTIRFNTAKAQAEQLKLTGPTNTGTKANPDEAIDRATPVRTSILADATTTNRRSSTNRLRASGRVSFNTQSLRTLTDAREEGLPRSRTSFSSTTASVRTSVDRLPRGLKANIHFRAAYRKSSTATTLAPQSIRVYKASIEKRFSSKPISFEIGRFYSIHEDFSGYWDGAIVRYGPRRMGAGVAFGFEPSLSNEGFDTNLPKYSVFADFRARGRGMRYDADISFHEIRGQNQYSKHDYIGIQQSIRATWVRVSQDLQVNRNPETSSWMITRFQTNASIPIAKQIRLTGRFLVRRPYYVWRTQNFMSTRRDRISVGANSTVGSGVAGLRVTSNRYEGQDPYTTYSSFLNLSKTRLAGIGFTSSASYWTRNDTRAVSANAGISKLVGRLFLRARYRYYRTK